MRLRRGNKTWEAAELTRIGRPITGLIAGICPTYCVARRAEVTECSPRVCVVRPLSECRGHRGKRGAINIVMIRVRISSSFAAHPTVRLSLSSATCRAAQEIYWVRLVLMLLNKVSSPSLKFVSPTMIPTATMAAMRPYSMAVAPDSSFTKVGENSSHDNSRRHVCRFELGIMQTLLDD